MTPDELSAEHERLLTFLKQEEGYRQHPYKCTGGYWTVGWGRNLEAVGIREEEATAMLRNDMFIARGDAQEICAERGVDWNALTVDQRNALAAMAFQLGKRGLGSFKKMFAMLAAGDARAASAEALQSKWARQTPSRAMRTATMIGAGRVRAQGDLA